MLLNSHTDVVPAEAARWTAPPFAAAEFNGSIYARGVQDMKVWGRVGGWPEWDGGRFGGVGDVPRGGRVCWPRRAC